MRCTMDPEGLNGGKYTLRTKSILKRIESERTRQVGTRKKESKEKQKPPPLSKYRRKTANARERNRMREINDAFVTLQESLPDLPGTEAEKLTKITVLKLAVNYIKALAKVLDNDFLEPTDINEVKELWYNDNIHIAKSENCVRSVLKANKATPNLLKNSKAQMINKVSNKPSKSKQTTPIKSENQNDKDKQTVKPPKRKSKSSKSRGKICRTASVATSNGAYITLKNVAMQTRCPGRAINNEPLMMSMTVKRPRLEPFNSSRPSKLPKLEPFISNRSIKFSKASTIFPLVALADPHTTTSLSKTKLTPITSFITNSNIREPMIGTTPTHLSQVCRTLPEPIQSPYQFQLTPQPVNTITPANLQFTSYKPPFTTLLSSNSPKYTVPDNINIIDNKPLEKSTQHNEISILQSESLLKQSNLSINNINTSFLNIDQDIKPLYQNLSFDDNTSIQQIQPIEKSSPITIPSDSCSSPISLQPVDRQSPCTEPYTGGLTFQDLDSPVIRNDVLLEFPHNNRHSSTSSADSAFYSEGSDPESPVSTTFTNTPIGDISPCSSYSSLSVGSHHSDCDNVLAASMEFTNIFGYEPFEEEIDHLTSTFGDSDDTLNMLLDHASSSFICNDIDGC